MQFSCLLHCRVSKLPLARLVQIQASSAHLQPEFGLLCHVLPDSQDRRRLWTRPTLLRVKSVWLRQWRKWAALFRDNRLTNNGKTRKRGPPRSKLTFSLYHMSMSCRLSGLFVQLDVVSQSAIIQLAFQPVPLPTHHQSLILPKVSSC